MTETRGGKVGHHLHNFTAFQNNPIQVVICLLLQLRVQDGFKFGEHSNTVVVFYCCHYCILLIKIFQASRFGIERKLLVYYLQILTLCAAIHAAEHIS